jgi:LmbE family N-acetylglucosaminyl deacetylase
MNMSEQKQLTLMAVFAHPDDESFGTGGTLARYGVDPEVRVVLVCATRGEAGEISDPQLATPDHLGEVRERELRCACQTFTFSAIATRAWQAHQGISIPAPWPWPMPTKSSAGS